MSLATPPSKGTNAALWIVTALPGLALFAAGAMKLRGAPEVAANFEKWGYPPWFAFVTGAIEVAGAVGLFVPRVAPFAAVLLGCTMAGAALTHLTHGEASHVLAPLALMLMVAIVGYGRRAPLVALFARR